VLKTRGAAALPETFSGRQQWLMRNVLRVEPEAIQLLLDRPGRYERERLELDRLCAGHRVFAIGPSAEDPTVARLTRARAELEAGARIGARAVLRVFGDTWQPPAERDAGAVVAFDRRP
jgi:hypothetical protein